MGMDANSLRDHYKRLLEAANTDMATEAVAAMGAAEALPQVPAEQDPAMQQAPDAPELQQSQAPEAAPEMGLARPIRIPRFTPNLHRYAYQPGEVVNFYDDDGAVVQASIVGPPQGDRFDVVDTEGQQHEVVKSELFYPAMQAEMGAGEMPEEAPVEDSA
jgi:hypothetical protein